MVVYGFIDMVLSGSLVINPKLGTIYAVLKLMGRITEFRVQVTTKITP